MQRTNKSNPKTPTPTPCATQEPMSTQLVLQQAGFLGDSLPNPASQLTEQSINAMGPDEMCRMLINTMDPDEMRRMLLRRASQAVQDKYGSEIEADSTLHRPATSEQAQDERDDWEDLGSETDSEDGSDQDDQDEAQLEGAIPEPEATQDDRDVPHRADRQVSNWAANPHRAPLHRAMGITADMDSRSQEQLSRDLRRDVRRLACIDFKKTWTELKGEGKTEEMTDSMPTPLPLVLLPALLIRCRQGSWKG